MKDRIAERLNIINMGDHDHVTPVDGVSDLIAAYQEKCDEVKWLVAGIKLAGDMGDEKWNVVLTQTLKTIHKLTPEESSEVEEEE